MNINVHPNPGLEQMLAVTQGSQLNNEGLALRRAGDLAGAEKKDLEAICLKEAAFGSDNITTALSYNSLGEVYLEMGPGKLDDAEKYLKLALAVRENTGPKADLACTRDNLGKVYEMRGEFRRAKEYRRGREDAMCCGNDNCYNTLLPLLRLKNCSRCGCIYYCSPTCQLADWKRHKKYCKPSQ